MRIVLENEMLCAEIESFGAELKSLVKKEPGQEYVGGRPVVLGQDIAYFVPFYRQTGESRFSLSGKIL